MKAQSTSIATSLAVILTSIVISTTALADDNMLTDKAGMALYTYDKDSTDVSNCYGRCEDKWPPYLAGANAEIKSGYGITTRKDGSKQWTYNSKPLYTWVGDSKKGIAKGDGVGNVWRTAIPTN